MMVPLISLLLMLAASLLPVAAQTPLPLWSGAAPGALGAQPDDIPTLTPFLADPANASGAAMVICPGGGYGFLADYEGADYARWLNRSGISAFVLRYRLAPAYHHPAMLDDAARAMRTVRARAAEWKLDPHRLGIIGSSAGGHLASTLMTHFDAGQPGAADPVERESSRPDLGVLCYPVISLGPSLGHGGSRENLLGRTPSPELVREFSNELHVTPQTPPCFVWTTGEDREVRPENTLEFAAALQKAGVPYDLHVYQQGVHGIGTGGQASDAMHPWTRDCVYWLKAQGFLKP